MPHFFPFPHRLIWLFLAADCHWEGFIFSPSPNFRFPCRDALEARSQISHQTTLVETQLKARSLPHQVLWSRHNSKPPNFPSDYPGRDTKLSPGSLVETLSKPVLSPTVLHCVLTADDLRAPGDVVEHWQPQRTEPHAVEMFSLDKNNFSKGQLGLLKLFPDKLVFEAPAGDGEYGDLDNMTDEVCFDFSDIYAMHAILEDR